MPPFGAPIPATPGPPLFGPCPPAPSTPAQAVGSTSIVSGVALPPKPATPCPVPLPKPCTPVPPVPGRVGNCSSAVPVPFTPILRPLTSTPIWNSLLVSAGCVRKPAVAGPMAVNCVSVRPAMFAPPYGPIWLGYISRAPSQGFVRRITQQLVYCCGPVHELRRVGIVTARKRKAADPTKPIRKRQGFSKSPSRAGSSAPTVPFVQEQLGKGWNLLRNRCSRSTGFSWATPAIFLARPVELAPRVRRLTPGKPCAAACLLGNWEGRTSTTWQWRSSCRRFTRRTWARSNSNSPARVVNTKAAALRKYKLPDKLILIPGVIDPKSKRVEHPEVVAQRIQTVVAAVGDRKRVIAGVDCGFATFVGWEWVTEDAVWADLALAAWKPQKRKTALL